ncbi:hypothetical protein CHCC20333_1100 [Bacillus paralicheniformis]|nr:hypothetical protein CHCC20333_1100 [Bacillus paralicheniformis]
MFFLSFPEAFVSKNDRHLFHYMCQTSPLFKACLYHKRKTALSRVIIASRT